MSDLSDLKNELQQGLSVVSDLWSYKTRDWVTCIHSIDNDGEVEILVSSRDGRIHALASGDGEYIWRRVVGDKKWVSAVIGIPPRVGEQHPVSVFVGTQDGKVYALDERGQTISKDRQFVYPFENNGWAFDRDRDKKSFWHSSKYQVRRLVTDLVHSSQVVIDSEDHYVYALDYNTGGLIWTFPTGTATVQAVCCCDINGDGKVETLVSTSDQHLYVLNAIGDCILSIDVQGQIHTIYAVDIDKDGKAEILLGVDGKSLSLLTLPPDNRPCVRLLHRFPNRFLELAVADVDGDGENEILVGSEDKYLYVLETSGKEIWRCFLERRISSLYAVDIDSDGLAEVFIGLHDSKDSRVSALRIRLIKGLNERIRQLYHEVDHSSPTTLEEGLSQPQHKLLQELVREAKPTSKPVTLKQVESLLEAKRYELSLLGALTLEQQNIEEIWRIGHIGIISTLCIGNISSDPRLEVAVGTQEGQVHAYSWAGTELWSLHLGGPILAMQTAYIDMNKYTRVIACSADNHMHAISGIRRNSTTGRIVIGGDVIQKQALGEKITNLYVSEGETKGSLDIIIGLKNKKIVVYGRDLAQPQRIIEPPQEIRVVSAHITHKDNVPMVVAGSEGDVDHMVYAYTCSGSMPLWTYKTKGRVEALRIREIDNEGNTEIVIGSQDRNVHVLDQHGKLKWRYYLPSSVLAVDICDVDKDGKLEILAGCDDGQLYVFNQDGDMLWKYQSHGSIFAIRAADIDVDNNVEIIIGSESQLEVLRVVDQKPLLDLIDECWQALQQESPEETLIEEFRNHQSHLLRSFALRKMAEQKVQSQNVFNVFESFIKDGSVEVRKALIQAVVASYQDNPQKAQYILSQLVMDSAIDVRLTLVTNIGHIMRCCEGYWDDAFRFLQRFTRNNSRSVRRAVMRELYLLVNNLHGTPRRKRMAIELLLVGLLEPEAPSVQASDWVRQEAARTLAHFLDCHRNDLVMYIYLFMVRGVKNEILLRVANHARTTFVRDVFSNLGTLDVDLNEANGLEQLTKIVNALKATKALRYGEETLTLYEEFRHLLGLETIEDVSEYQCTLKEDASTTNTHFSAAVSVFMQLNFITRALRLYRKREGIKDRVNALLEANNAIERARVYAEQVYATTMALDEPIAKLPDRAILDMLFKRWQATITSELRQLSEKPRLVPEIQTKFSFFDEQIAVWLLLRNNGGSTADMVHIELLNSEQFDIVGRNSFETEAIFAKEEVIIEFTIRPHTRTPNLVFEIAYRETEITDQIFLFDSQLKLYTPIEQPQFKPIPNPYSTGVPTTDMCYGREDDLKFLQDNLTRVNTGTFLILYGQRRSGKTTLLLQLANTHMLEPHIALHIDMQHESYGMSESKFFYNIAFYITEALRKKGIHVQLDEEEHFKGDPTFILNRFLDEVEQYLEARKLLILIDEFEILGTKVEDKILAPEVFEYLRSIVQRHPSMTFLFAGVHNIRQLTAGYWSPFFNIAVHHRLSKLSERGALSLITVPVKGFLDYDIHALKKIRQLTADQPYLIHLVCRPLVDYCNEKRKTYVTINDVNAILDTIMENSQLYFEWLWGQYCLDDHYILAIMAELGGEGGRSLSLVEIEVQCRYYALPYKREAALQSLKSLVERDMVEKILNTIDEEASSYERYRLPVGLIREWIRKTKSVKQVRHEEER